MQDTEDEVLNRVQRHQGESDEDYLTRLSRDSESNDNPLALTLRYSEELNLTLPIAFLALNIADTADSLNTLEHHPVMAIAGASLYVASHLLNQRRSLAEIARLAAVSERDIHNVYKLIYADRYELIDEDWRQTVGGAATLGEAAEALPSLPWPPLELAYTDGEGEDEERMDVDDDGSALRELVRELCFEFYGDNNLDNPSWMMAQQIADRMDCMTLDWKTVNPWTIAAACTYMGSHLVFQGKTFEEVGRVSGMNPAVIRNTYEVMYGAREQIVQEDWFQTFFWTRENALYCLPEP